MDPISSILSMVLGGTMRLAPEVLDFFDRKNKRAHELAMADKEAAKQSMNDESQEIVAATNAQAAMSGVKWADALSVTVRPVLTYWWAVVLYTAYMVACFVVMVQHNSTANTLIKIFGPEEKAMVQSMISFWFVDRALRHMRTKQNE